MEFDLIPQLIIIFSAGAIIFILGRSIPKIKDIKDDDLLFGSEKGEEKEKFSYLYGRLKRRIKKDSYQKKADLVWKWLEKSLRKIRIKFLKLDNAIVSILEKLKKKNKKREGNNSGEIKTEAETNNKNEDLAGDENSVASVAKPKENNFKSGGLDSVNKLEVSEIVNKEEQEIKSDKKIAKTSKEKEYINLILKSPKNIKAYWKLGIIYSRRKKYKDSISCFRQIIKIDPNYTKAKKKVVDLVGRMKKDKKTDKEK
ncbi:MAG: tetratricopeptide repeat protein [Patescibacteria group bacterium]|nr:tetratricopeptide repeat protein [Patescibacteria group bacterium]